MTMSLGTEEPCEVESLTHGFEAGAGGAIPSSTVTGRGQRRLHLIPRLQAAPLNQAVRLMPD